MTREGLKEISRGSPLPSLRPPLFPPLVSNNLYLFMLHLCYMIPYRAYFCLMNNINVGTVCISYARLLHVFVNPSLLHLFNWLLFLLPASASVVVTADEAVRGGKTIPLKSIVDEAVGGCQCVQRVLVSRRTGAHVPMTPRDLQLEQVSPAKQTIFQF